MIATMVLWVLIYCRKTMLTFTTLVSVVISIELLHLEN